MSDISKYKPLLAGAAVALSVFSPQGASALEEIVPFQPGVSVGVPVGALPPPGFYFSQSYSVFDIELRDNRGRPTGIKITDVGIAPQLLWVPEGKILGATYGAYVVQPFRRAGTEIGGLSSADFGPINTVISPLNLSWNLGGGFFVSAGLSFYTGAWGWSLGNSNNPGRNYWTIEPSLGFSYLADGWNLSLHPLIDFNSRNNANRYQSGTIFVMDYNASKRFGKWELGLGGTLIEQITNDEIDGIVAPAIPGIRGRGNRGRSLNVGPVIGYDFGPVALKGYFLKEIYAENIPGGNRFYLRVDVPLTSKPPGPGGGEAGGVRN